MTMFLHVRHWLPQRAMLAALLVMIAVGLMGALGAAHAQSAVGRWTGYWVITGGDSGTRKGERLEVDWTFNANGDFVETGGSRVGSWRQNGSYFEFNFDNSTVFRGAVSGNQMTGTFALPNGTGVSGDFSLNRASVQTTSLPGTWSGWLQFDGSSRADYAWTFYNDGTFSTSYDTYGTCSQNGSKVTWRFNDPPNTVYTGTISGSRITGTMSNSGGGGVFDISRGGSSSSGGSSASSSLAGSWNGYWVVRGGQSGGRNGERLNVSWSFSSNGEFRDSTGSRVGSWWQTGNQIQFAFDGSTLFKGTINGNRVSGTFALPEGGGVYGDFELTR
jgi:hypothetical protein